MYIPLSPKQRFAQRDASSLYESELSRHQPGPDVDEVTGSKIETNVTLEKTFLTDFKKNALLFAHVCI